MVLHERASNIGLLQQMITWYMVVGKPIIIPTLGHQNKGKSSFTGPSAGIIMSLLTTMYHVIVCCKRPIGKPKIMYVL